MNLTKTIQSKKTLKHIAYFAFCMISGTVFAADATLGTMASSITSTFGSVSKLITAGSYIAGLGFAISAIMKFKQHKDNPTQVPIGTPIGLTFIAAALLFLPSVLNIAGSTIFGKDASTAGPKGTIYEIK